MTRDDPFAEPSDTDKTIVRPNPGGRRPAAPAHMPPPQGAQTPSEPAPARAHPQAQHGRAQQAAAQATVVPVKAAATGMNPLNAAAATLFALVARIRNRAQHANPAALRESVIAEIRAFEHAAIESGVAAQTVRVARYALCATIDDVVLNTPWGGSSVWAQRSMVGTFHKETHGGDRFYDLLARLEASPAVNRDLLEFLYMCLSLGFEGRLRVEPRGSERHMAIRDGLARLIRTHRGSVEPDLSPRWKGVTLAHRLISAWTPVWLAGGLTLLGVCAAFAGFSLALDGSTEALRDQIAGLDVAGPVTLDRPAPPPPPAPPAPREVETVESVAAFLKPEIDEGLVTVESAGNTLAVRISGENMFAPASDTLEPRFAEVVDRVAAALNVEGGRIIVAGHSDNVPIRTARFPSNLALSLARAKFVMERLSQTLTDGSRITAEGRADREPVASNDTPEGRAKNRRIEVILVKAG
ncbi:type VI secretion system protein TssL, long form [Sulfitobacter sp. LCG007]